ncbi:uncharacterized protein F5147DRAFT_588110 [Suillus discolor]|uniref:ubiquitinyl hydrolase 1 n=1 Tax=Suillus discolor TaxID=1912936 RepID=A0A9P7ESY2_9AGAM|nr:uncharacterized protein F5147DRAFT_588110 [Suillus discolor]KAG2087459.1 hypothetical protein F5147DRAFT_588110 [Suillus discolor]
MSASTSEPEETPVLQYIITHIFCPIKLPQCDDYTADRDRALLDLVLDSARNFASRSPDSDQEHWSHLLKMLEHLGVAMTSTSLTQDVESQIRSMRAGDVLAYLIRAQNAAVVLRRLDEKTIFESFEVSPLASTVMAAQGKLLCSYPGPAIAVPNSTVDNPTFLPELSNFLAHMNRDVLDSAATMTEGRSTVLKHGDTAHPRYITELLTGILRAFGEPADILRIRKRIGDDVSCSKGNLPWRRSSLWLVIRVVLQTSLERTTLGRQGYKAFMASLMTDLVFKALQEDLSSDLLYFMSTKISRRLVKLQVEDGFLVEMIHNATEGIRNRLELRWKDVQDAQAHFPHWDASKIDIDIDTRLSLPASEEYIVGVLQRTYVQPTVPDFQPPHYPRGTIDDFLDPDDKFFADAYAKDPLLTLSDFECAIEQGITGWVDKNINLDAGQIDVACLTIQACATSYATRVGGQLSYSNNPENKSIMLLTLFELWAALDKLAVKSIPLLKEYSPEVPVTIFNRLLLQNASDLVRLKCLQQYVAARIRDAHSGFSVFSNSMGVDTFALRCYRQSEELQSLKRKIEHDAGVELRMRIDDLHEKNAKYEDLTRDINALTCGTYMDARGSSRHDNNGCRKCRKLEERKRLSIEIHEWPLPYDGNHAAVVIFELGAPTTFKMWRSFTVHLLHDICTPATKPTESATQYMLLTHYKPLLNYHSKRTDQHITLASETQSFLSSQSRLKSLPCTESDIRVKNGLRFRLYHATRGVWMSNLFRNTDISDLCMYKLPPGPYHGLQNYLSGTEHTSNEVLANQASCPAELTLHEFIAFGNLRSGRLLQWFNILREIRARTLAFRDPEVHFLLLQASREVGELSGDGYRVWHDELRVSDFGHALIDELQSLKVAVEANWLEWLTMATISTLASRLLSSAEDSGVIERLHNLLRVVRDSTFKLVQELSKALQDAADEKSRHEIRDHVRNMAAICRSTYDVGPDNISELLKSSHDLEILVYCAIILRDNTPLNIHNLSPASKLLLERDRRLSHFLEIHFRRHVESSDEGLDQAMIHLWPAYRRHARWTVLESPNSRWLRCETAPSSDVSRRQIIHLDILTACLLVDGKPLRRLPESFLEHASYRVLFDDQELDVFPAEMPGFEFATKALIHGFQLFFGMHSQEVVIRSKCDDGDLLELIPQHKLESDVPAFLLEDHVHWLNLRTHAIEFRPKKRMWEPSDKNWVLRFMKGGQSVVQRGQSTLFDIHSPTFHMIAKTLGPLEDLQYLVVTRSVEAGQTVVKVELPRFGLSFFNRDGDLHSHDQRGMVVDENQSTGTMLGLVNQLVLRPKDQRTYSNRRVIIPQGIVKVKPEGHHVQVTIHTSSDTVRRPYHCYTVDTELCRLAGNIDFTNKLYKVYLHAVCSAHVADPLTKRTGVEEAMYLLQSAACYSFMKLNQFDCDLLAQLGSLTVRRTWHRTQEMCMQNVHWQDGLSSYIQSCAFYHAVRNIVQYAQKLRVLQEVSIGPNFPAQERSLLERGSQRSIVLYSRDFVHSFYPIKSSSSEYPARDMVYRSIDEQRSYDCACMVRDWSITLEPCQSLYDVFAQWNKVSGEMHNISLRYDEGWLNPELSKKWISFYELCRHANRETRTFQLAFTLSAMAYSSPENVALTATMFAFAVNPKFRSISSPKYDLYDLSFGIKSLEHNLCHRIPLYSTFQNSPEASLSRHSDELSRDFDARREELFQSQCLCEQKEAINVLLGLWPCYSVPSRALECLSGARYDKSSLAAYLETLYSNCYRNHCLKIYLDQVQDVLDEVRRIPLPSVNLKQPYTFAPSNSVVVSVITVVLTEDLFKKPAPVVTLLSDDSDPLAQLESSFPLIGNSSGSGLHLTALDHVISTFSRSQSDKFGRQYAKDLQDSRIHLDNQQSSFPPNSMPTLVDMLQLHHTRCNELYSTTFHDLEECLAPSGVVEWSLFNSGQWPRITISFLLQLLASMSRTHLCDSWKTALTKFAHILLRLQRSKRLLRLVDGGDHEELVKELVNNGYQKVDRTQGYLDWLLIQADNRFLIRPMQADVATEMIRPKSEDNTALQLHMGEGKSSVIVPICCAALANGEKLVRVIVPKPLAVQMFQLLVERLSGLTNRRIFYLPFSRSSSVSPGHAETIQSLFDECKRVGGILVAQPDHILSFKLMTVAQQLPPANAGGQGSLTGPTASLLDSQRWLDTYTRDILDESDELLRVRFQLVYAMGPQQHLEGHPDRWAITQQVMTLVAKHAYHLHQEFPLGVEFRPVPGAVGRFSRFRVLDVRAGEKLVQLLANDVLNGELPNLALGHVPSHIKDTIRKCVTVPAIDVQYLDQVRSYCTGSSLWNGLLLIRGLLALGILISVLKERQWRIDYGLDPQRTLLAVPYRAKDVPSSKAEFGHPDISIALTCLSYYYAGLTKEQLATCFRQLQKQDNPTLEYETWIKGLPLPENLRYLSGINTVESTEQFTACLMHHFAHNKAVVDFFLAHVVFPKEAKGFPHKLSCSAWDLAEQKSSRLPTTGFSGTNDLRYLLPTSISQRALSHQRGTNATVLMYLLQHENDHYDSHAAGEGALELLRVIAKQKPEIRVLLDVGARVLELQNDEVAEMWLEINQDAQAAIYFNEHDELVVRTRDQLVEPFIVSCYAQRLDKCVLYLDDAHTRGTDISFPQGFRAAVTLGPKVTKDRLVQGCMRMRKLGCGHSVMFFAPPEVDRNIRAVNNKGDTEDIHVSDILVWAMTETCSDIQHHTPQWIQHGMDYRSRNRSWSSFLSGNVTPAAFASSWLQPEARHLEELYATVPVGYSASRTLVDEDILERFHKLGFSILPDTRLDEEQVREVVNEVELEREVERPLLEKPAKHVVHEDVRSFIQTGCIREGSGVFTPIFDILTTTSVAIPKSQPWTHHVLASRDFATVMHGFSDKTDNYIRPVNWILSSTASGVPVLAIISPFEVNDLLPDIRASTQVHLHLYTPRVIRMMKPCDDLRLYSIPSLPVQWMPPEALILQLNTFAGQLYFPHYSTYVRLCRFLGIYIEGQGEFKVQSDGFIRPEDRSSPAANQPDLFEQSPIPMLKALFNIRRKGMGYLPTHIGKMLSARRLTDEDFEEIA